MSIGVGIGLALWIGSNLAFGAWRLYVTGAIGTAARSDQTHRRRDLRTHDLVR